MKFAQLPVDNQIKEKIAQKGFETATPVQAECIPLMLQGKDVIACAKTGSGKTLAFAIPIIQALIENPPQDRRQLTGTKKPLALVLAPTRELALQIEEEVAYFLQQTDFRSVAVFGGVDYDKQKKVIAENPEIVVATPGRLLDFLQSRDLALDEVMTVVLDEADRMLDMGFIDDVKKIVAMTGDKRKIHLFSATLNYSAIYSVWEYMHDPIEVMINPEVIDHSKIDQSLLHLGRDEKLPYLIKFLEASKLDPVIIFTNTKRFVDTLVANLNHYDIPAQGISSTVNQKKRITVINDFKEKKFRVLVATDVASRGLHIEDIQMVVNYDIPQDPESYVHRIGRTARAGKSGVAVSICSEMDYDNLQRLESHLKYKLKIQEPDSRILEQLQFIRIIFVPQEDDFDGRRNSRDRKGRDNKNNNSRSNSTRRDGRRDKVSAGPRRPTAGHSAQKSHGGATREPKSDFAKTNGTRPPRRDDRKLHSTKGPGKDQHKRGGVSKNNSPSISPSFSKNKSSSDSFDMPEYPGAKLKKAASMSVLARILKLFSKTK